jgi:hypothetical protein
MFILLFGAAILATIVALWWVYRSSSKPDNPLDPEEPVVLTSTMDSLKAELLVSKLDAFGIRSYIHSTWSYGPYRAAFWPTWYRVMVRNDQQDAAREILNMHPDER